MGFRKWEMGFRKWEMGFRKWDLRFRKNYDYNLEFLSFLRKKINTFLVFVSLPLSRYVSRKVLRIKKKLASKLVKEGVFNLASADLGTSAKGSYLLKEIPKRSFLRRFWWYSSNSIAVYLISDLRHKQKSRPYKKGDFITIKHSHINGSQLRLIFLILLGGRISYDRWATVMLGDRKGTPLPRHQLLIFNYSGQPHRVSNF